MFVRQLSVSSSRTPALGAATPALFASPSFRPRNVEAVEDDMLALDDDDADDGAAGNIGHGHKTTSIEQPNMQLDEQQQQPSSHHKAHVPLASIEEWYGAAPALYLFGIHTPLRRACIRIAESRALRWLVLACIMVRAHMNVSCCCFDAHCKMCVTYFSYVSLFSSELLVELFCQLSV